MAMIFLSDEDRAGRRSVKIEGKSSVTCGRVERK
jgi:hypothetical protein